MYSLRTLAEDSTERCGLPAPSTQLQQAEAAPGNHMAPGPRSPALIRSAVGHPDVWLRGERESKAAPSMIPRESVRTQPRRINVSTTIEDLNLSQLASTANAEYKLTLASAQSAVLHAIRCGEALHRAKELIPLGGWTEWVKANLDITRDQATTYIRLYTYRDELLQPGGPTRLQDARDYLTALQVPVLTGSHFFRREMTSDQVDRARRLREDGGSWQAVALAVGVSTDMIRRRLDPVYRQQRKKIKRENKAKARKAHDALEREERDRTIKAMEGLVPEAYGYVRRLAQTIDRSMEQGTPEQRVLLASALREVHAVEAKLVNVLQIQRRL